MSCETLHVLNENLDAECCFYREEPHKDRIYTTILRAFVLASPEQRATNKKIGSVHYYTIADTVL